MRASIHMESTAFELSKQNEMQNITRNGAVTKPKLISITYVCTHICRLRIHIYTYTSKHFRHVSYATLKPTYTSTHIYRIHIDTYVRKSVSI